MAYLTFTGSEEKSSCFKFIGADISTTSTGLISDNTSLISNNTSLISSNNSDDGFDTCSFYSGPSEATIIAFGENSESCGTIAFASSESCGTIAYSSAGESCGSIASSSVSSSSSSLGGGCSYSC